MSRDSYDDKEKAIKILDYWFLMEFLNQQKISDIKKIEKDATDYKRKLSSGSIKHPYKVVENLVPFKPENNLQNITKTATEEFKLSVWSDFTVFIGAIRKETCIQKIAQNIEWNGQSPDENYDEIAIAALKFSKDGNYIVHSLSISPLAWATKKLSGAASYDDQKLSIEEYNSETRVIETQIETMFRSEDGDDPAVIAENAFPISEIVSYELLEKIENIILEELELSPANVRTFYYVYFKLYDSNNDIDEDESGIGLRSDFFSNDLLFAKDGLKNNHFTKEKEKLLLDYILGLNRYGNDAVKPPPRFDVIKQEKEELLYQFMSDKLAAAKAPLGKWPSRFMPALMQQIAVNFAINEDANLPVFSVNGPPGTGKTTLLKEIIVNNIVEKARLLANYENADDAFFEHSFLHGECPDNSYNQYVRKYHSLIDKRINSYSVLVVSSNNTAVENITKELPVEKTILKDLKPSKEDGEANKAALNELIELFTVSNSTGRLPLIKKEWSEYTDKDGNKEKKCEKIVEEQPDIYFSKLAANLLKDKDKKQDQQQAFGLISAALGKKTNINKVETCVIEPLLDIMRTNESIIQRKPAYLEARKRFLDQLTLVQKLCKELDVLPDKEKEVFELCRTVDEKSKQLKAHQKNQAIQLPKIEKEVHSQQENINQVHAEKGKAEQNITAIRSTCANLEATIEAQQNDLATTQAKTERLQSSISIFSKLFKTEKYKATQETVKQANEIIANYQQQIDDLTLVLSEEKQKEAHWQNESNLLLTQINDENRKLEELCLRKESIISEEQRLKKELKDVQREVEKQKTTLDNLRLKYQSQDSYNKVFVLDRKFVSDILSSDIEVSTDAQIRNPWFSERYNREREKLFLYALLMTKEFILSSKKCRDNFKHLRCLWSGSYDGKERIKFRGEDLQNCTTAAYETLFLLIPVISSTFASVQSLFKNVKEESIIGTMVVDEAGQSSPHMAIGALCRSRKAIIVGDPKQVEPVVTDDQDLLKQTFTDELLKNYKDKSNSVQRFADIINPYGTYLKDSNGSYEWVGCPLLVHRRCISPMYEISNDISYNNIMKQQAKQPDKDTQSTFIECQSQWINVRGKETGEKMHFVKEQGDKVIQMLEVAFSKNPDPDIFIISPFTTVESGIKDYVKKYVRSCKRDGEQSFLLMYEESLDTWLKRNVGTVHKFQGREAAEVIFLLGCDTSEAAKPAIMWVNTNIVNVAATRAKYRFYVIGDIEAWKNSKCVNRAKKILDSYTAGSLGWVPKNYAHNSGYTLVITEKPSVAEAYAKALCVWNEKPNEFYEGNGYLISWCLGHLVELAPPEQYNVKYKKWNINDLPIIPDEWKYQVMDSKDPNEKKRIEQRFEVLKTLMNRDDVTAILCATDAGREGELIFRLVYQQTECKKPVKRIWLSSMEPNSIRAAFENPRPATDYDSLYEAAKCRSWADWIVGMNATRFYTCRDKNKTEDYSAKVLRVGRVVTPTLAMVVEREKEINDFVPKTLYTVKLKAKGITFESQCFENEDEAIRIEQKCKENT